MNAGFRFKAAFRTKRHDLVGLQNTFRALVQIPSRTRGGRKAVGTNAENPSGLGSRFNRPKRVEGEIHV
jgi:hypothetical protein